MTPNINPDALTALRKVLPRLNETDQALLRALCDQLDKPVPFVLLSPLVFQVQDPRNPAGFVTLGLEPRLRDRPPMAAGAAHLALLFAGERSVRALDFAGSPKDSDDDNDSHEPTDITQRALATVADQFEAHGWIGAAAALRPMRTLQERVEGCPPMRPNWADNTVRNGLSRFVDYLELHGQRVIAHAVRQITVAGGIVSAPKSAAEHLILS